MTGRADRALLQLPGVSQPTACAQEALFQLSGSQRL
jgi:hypothetical protein